MQILDDSLPILCRAGQPNSPEAKSRHRGRELGASMVEYILLVALIALAVIGAVSFLSQQTEGKFQDAGNKIAAANGRVTVECGTDTIIAGTTNSQGQNIATCQRPDGSTYTTVVAIPPAP
jgi:Flp pilus assembly pilin Flp